MGPKINPTKEPTVKSPPYAHVTPMKQREKLAEYLR
jgi:hypothetical protein